MNLCRPPQLLALMCIGTSLSQPAMAQSIETLAPPPPGYLYSYIWEIAGDGNTFLTTTGTAGFVNETAIYDHAAGSYTYVPGMDNFARVYLSGDGTTVLGIDDFATYNNFIWTAGTGTVPIATPAGISVLEGSTLNYDGTVVAGTQIHLITSDIEAFYWTQGTGVVGMGYLPGAATNRSTVTAISDDGRYIVGEGRNAANDTEAFLYDRNSSILTGLGIPLGEIQSGARAISGDGSTVIGYTYDGGFMSTGFYWTAGTGMVSLGRPAGFINSDAFNVTYDGSEIYGSGSDGVDIFSLHWTLGTGWELTTDYLTASGVDLTGVTFEYVSSTSNDGSVLYARADLGSGSQDIIVQLGAGGGGGGVITPQDLAASLSLQNVPSVQMAQVSMSSVANSIYAARMLPPTLLRAPVVESISSPISAAGLSPAAGEEPDFFARIRPTLSGYTYGSLGFGQDNDGDNSAANGTTGIRAEIGDNLYAGIGVVGSSSREEMPYGGASDLKSFGFSAIASYEGPTGARVYGAAFASKLNADIKRNYPNGGSIDTSSGDTSGYAYGIAAHGGWEMPVTQKTTVQPYAEVYGTHAQLDGYEESGGAFDSTVSSRSETTWTTRLGAEVKTEIKPNLDLTFRGAWGHRLSGDSGSVDVTAIGITNTLSSPESGKNWAEIGTGIEWKASERFSLSADAMARSSRTDEPFVTMTVGASYKF